MTLYEVAAHWDEKQGITGGKPGDQTGNEVSVSAYHNLRPSGYNGILRYAGGRHDYVCNRMIKAGIILANDNKAGYAQDTRTQLYEQMRARKWALKGCKKIKPCNCDCSEFIGVLVNIALVPAGLAVTVPDWIWTGNEVELLTGRGFKWIRQGINLDTGAGLLPGDILVNVQDHTSLFIGNSSTGQLWPISGKTETTKPVQKLNVHQVAEKVIEGAYGDGPVRVVNLRKAGYDPQVIQHEVNRIMLGV